MSITILMTNKPHFFEMLAQTPPNVGYLYNEGKPTAKGLTALSIPLLLYFGLKYAAPAALGAYALPIAGLGALCYLTAIYLGRAYDKHRRLQVEIQKLENTPSEGAARPIVSRIEELYPTARFQRYDDDKKVWSDYTQTTTIEETDPETGQVTQKEVGTAYF